MTKVQKSLAKTGALLALAAAAGLSIFLGEKKTEEETQAKETAAKAFEFDKAKVKKVTLTAKGATTELEKEGEGWKLVAPVKARAEKSAVDAIVDKLAELKSKEAVADDASKAADYGLDAPQFVVKAVLEDGRELLLNVGSENSFDQSLYFTRSGDAKILLADSGLKFPLDKGLFDLRDKSLVTHEDKDVVALDVTAAAGAWSVERDGESFKLVKPEADKADKTTVEGVLSAVRGARAKAFVVEDVPAVAIEAIVAAQAAPVPDAKGKPAKGKAPKGKVAVDPTLAALEPYGLDRPVATVIFSIGADKAKKALLVGEKLVDGAKRTYAHLAEGGPVWEVEESLVASLGKSLADLRDKTMLSFERDKVTKAEIAAEGGKLVVTRTLEKGVDGGTDSEKFAVEGETAAPKSWKLTSMLYTLSNLKGAAFVEAAPKDLAKYGLATPRFTWTVYGEGGAVAGRLFVGSETGSRYYAKTDADRVYELEKATVDDLPKKKEDVVEQPPAPAAPEGAAAAGSPANGG